MPIAKVEQILRQLHGWGLDRPPTAPSDTEQGVGKVGQQGADPIRLHFRLQLDGPLEGVAERMLPLHQSGPLPEQAADLQRLEFLALSPRDEFQIAVGVLSIAETIVIVVVAHAERKKGPCSVQLGWRPGHQPVRSGLLACVHNHDRSDRSRAP